MWRRGGTSDALKRARALLAAKSNKTQHSHNRAADADAKSRVSSPSGSEVLWDVSLLDSSREGRGAAAASHSPSKAGGGRFLKKPPPPIPHEDKQQPSPQASALKKLAQKESRILGRQREAESHTPIPGSASGPPPSRRSGRGTTPSVGAEATGSPQAGSSSRFSWSQSMDSDEEEALEPMLSQKRQRSASPSAHLPCRDGPSLSTRAEVRLVPSGCRFSGPPAPSSDLSGSALEEILSLEELFPLGCDNAAESNRGPSQSDLDVDVKTLEDVGSAYFGNTSEEQMQVPDERGDGDSVQMVDYESDFESTERTETGHRGSSGRVACRSTCRMMMRYRKLSGRQRRASIIHPRPVQKTGTRRVRPGRSCQRPALPRHAPDLLAASPSLPPHHHPASVLKTRRRRPTPTSGRRHTRPPWR
ncbi:uncharacterized protein C19orf44 homolog isoform X2 [Syngnathus acus]|uniref:uncharacterized protein C19orf44 homolog isoform X2 n=1 Tax=Syngnathus acus TaxID=161584 RepID=UPI00188622C6|nr:uncharacterized protein C19orf44 homolog isoform X2 [Syngnathus acus]